MNTAAVTRQIAAYLESNCPEVDFAYLFGSVARECAKPDSDVDVAIHYRSDPPRTLEGAGMGIAGELEAELGRPVDLVVLNRAPADLVHRVLRDGILLMERAANARIAFEVQRRNEYWDLLPILKRYRRTG